MNSSDGFDWIIALVDFAWGRFQNSFAVSLLYLLVSIGRIFGYKLHLSGKSREPPCCTQVSKTKYLQNTTYLGKYIRMLSS